MRSSRGLAVEDAAIQRLEACVREAARDAQVPSVIAMVVAPSIGLGWRLTLGGARGDGATAPQVGTPFRIASVTKLFMAAAVLRLFERGSLTLESPIDSLISEQQAGLLRSAGYEPAHITIDHLLTHTGGLPDHASLPAYVEAVLRDPRRRWSRSDQLAMAMTAANGNAQPGAAFRYSDTGYILLGEIVERLMGKSLGAATRELLNFSRIGLCETWWEDDEPEVAGLPPRARQWLADTDATDFDASFDRFGGGGIVSTVGDLARFAAALFSQQVFERPGTAATATVIPPCARDGGAHLHSRLAMVVPMGKSWGWGHLGFWGCGVAHCPSLGVTVAVTVNQPYPSDPSLRTGLISRLGAIAVELAMGARG